MITPMSQEEYNKRKGDRKDDGALTLRKIDEAMKAMPLEELEKAKTYNEAKVIETFGQWKMQEIKSKLPKGCTFLELADITPELQIVAYKLPDKGWNIIKIFSRAKRKG